MTIVANVPPLVVDLCRSRGLGEIAGLETLSGGVISRTRRLVTTTGATLVLKQSHNPPLGLYQVEAEGLDVLRRAGALRVPAVLAAGDDFLLLEDLGNVQPLPTFWAAYGQALAHQHQRTNNRFGFDHDNYLGLLPQHNSWMDDGHEFFVRNRLLRYLTEPLCDQTLTSEDRRDIEGIADRFRELVPPQPAALLHGDLWIANMLAGPEGQPAAADPAIYYGWPEAELSMVRQYGDVPQAFFAAYNEVHPLEPGWWDRLELLFLREQLSVIAHFGARPDTLKRLHEVLAKWR